MRIATSAGISLPASLDAVTRARRFALHHLHDWGCDAVCEDAQLIVSELVTNMVRHAPYGGYLKLAMLSDRVRITMTDHGDGIVERRIPPPGEPGGWGLLVVERLATAWGVELAPETRGHTVWCELPRPDTCR